MKISELMRKGIIALIIVAASFALVSCNAPAEEVQISIASDPPAEQEKTVDLGGKKVRADEKNLKLYDGGYSVDKLCAAASELDKLETLDLGRTSLDSAGLEKIREAFPNVDLSWQINFNGTTLDSSIEKLNLSELADVGAAATAEALKKLPSLNYIDLTGNRENTSLSTDSLSLIAAAAPQAVLGVRFDIFGIEADENTQELRYDGVNIGDEGVKSIEKYLPFLHSLRLLRLRECGISDNDAMAELREKYEGRINIVWSIELGGFPVMTDTTLINNPLLRDGDVDKLRYMPEILYLDIGHNRRLSSVDFVKYTPKLKTVIVSLTEITDISPFANCKDIELFECLTMPISDISVLAGMEKLEYVNIGNMPNLADISPLYGKKTLKMVRISGKTFENVTKEQIEKLQESVPDCFISTVGGDPSNSGNWKFNPDGTYTERYALTRKQMCYDPPYWQMRISKSLTALEGSGENIA